VARVNRPHREKAQLSPHQVYSRHCQHATQLRRCGRAEASGARRDGRAATSGGTWAARAARLPQLLRAGCAAPQLQRRSGRRVSASLHFVAAHSAGSATQRGEKVRVAGSQHTSAALLLTHHHDEPS
jgi:hypothetical protein